MADDSAEIDVAIADLIGLGRGLVKMAMAVSRKRGLPRGSDVVWDFKINGEGFVVVVTPQADIEGGDG